MPEDMHPAHIPWTVHSEREILKKQPFFTVVEQTVETANGTMIEDFYQIRLRSFAVVVPFLENGRVEVIRQYKHGPGKVSLGFPAGFVDEGEDPTTGARRELMEESGIAPDRLVALGDYVDNGNQRGCHGHYFLGLGCRRVADPDPGDLEAFEYLELTPGELDEAVMTGQFGIIHHVAAWGMVRMWMARNDPA